MIINKYFVEMRNYCDKKNRDKYSILTVKVIINIIIPCFRNKFIFNSILIKECHRFNIVSFSWEGEVRETTGIGFIRERLYREHTS